MSKSILQADKKCWFCETTIGLHCHHVFEGTGLRAKSEKYGLKVWLCGKDHNLSQEGVHAWKNKDLVLKKHAQKEFEKRYSHELFMKEFRVNWLGKDYEI